MIFLDPVRKIDGTQLLFKPEYIHPSLNRKSRRKRVIIVHPNDSKYIHKAANGKLYEKATKGGDDKILKDDRYGGRFK